MASKVNTKFVVLLTASLLVAFAGVAGLSYYVINKTGTTWERKGDRAAAQGDWRNAAEHYSRAVGHEKNNVAWLRKWDDALANWAPETETDFNEAYHKTHLVILSQIATSLQTDAKAYEDYLAVMYREFQHGVNRADAWEQMFNISQTALERGDLTSPQWQRVQRYRGLAQVNRMRLVKLGDEETRQARKDLEAALAVNPDDVEAALGVADWTAIQASHARSGGDIEGSDRLWNESLAAIDALAAKFPSDPRPVLRAWEMHADDDFQKALNVSERRRVQARLAPGLEPIVELAKAAAPETLDDIFIERLGQRLLAVRPADGAALWLAVIDALLVKQPTDSTLALFRGIALAQLDEGEQAIEQFQKIIDLPNPTVTWEGKRQRDNRRNAMRYQAERTLVLWERASPEERPSLMELVKKRRDALAEAVGSRHPALLRVDALMAMAESRHTEAVRHLTDLSAVQGGNDIETLYMLAFSLRAEGSLGAAVQQYDKVLRLDGSQTMALLGAADIELRLEQLDSARARFEKVLKVDPENKVATDQLALLDAIDTKSGAKPVSDPVQQALLEANRLLTQTEPDVAGAAAMIDRAMIASPDDMRLIQQRVAMHIQAGQKEPALQLVLDALKRQPDAAALKQLKIALEVSDPVMQQELIVEAMNATPMEKNLIMFTVYKAAGLKEKAAASLAKAVAEAPEDERVIEFQFVESLELGQLDAARALASKAAARNLDQVNGLMYQARLEMVENKLDAAIASLGRITQTLPFSAPAWRLLGQAQLNAGRVPDALDAFRRAMQYRPNDLTMVKPYVKALLDVGRMQEALEVVRQAVKRNAADEAVAELWLELEGVVPGGDRAKAKETRRRLITTRPTEQRNKIALARLYIQDKEWDDAQKIVESIKADSEDRLIPTLLEARILALRGQPDEARSKVAAYVEATPDRERKLNALIAMGEALIEIGLDEQGMASYREAREFQDPQRMEADRRLGDALFDRGRVEEAVDAYTRVLAGGWDESAVVAKRRAEALVRLGRWDDAEAAVLEVEKKSKRDIQTALLLADAAIGKNDLRAAKQRLDEAVNLEPNNPLGFFRRAQVTSRDKEQAALAVRDLDQAIRLKPDFTQARTLKAGILMQTGRESEALSELAAGVEATPEDDGLRSTYISELIRLRRTDDAKVALRTAVEKRAAANPVWFSNAGDIHAADKDFKTALDFYARGYDAKPGPETLGRVVDAMLKIKPPMHAEALHLINGAKQEVKDASPAAMAILRARAFAVGGKEPEAVKAMEEAWGMVRANPQQVRAWFDQMDEVFRNDTKKIERLFAQFAPAPEDRGPTGETMLATRVARDPKRWPEALKMLGGMEERTKDLATLLEVHRTRSTIHYLDGDYKAAVEDYRAALLIAPNSAEFLNNLAYVLARDLGNQAEAMPFAEKAALLDPTNPSILDTLGWLHLKADRLSAADEALTRASNAATRVDELVPILIHLAETKARLGDRTAARDMLDKAREAGSKDEKIWQANVEEHEAVNKLLGGAE